MGQRTKIERYCGVCKELGHNARLCFTGKRLGTYTGIKCIGIQKRRAIWLFRCDCGHERTCRPLPNRALPCPECKRAKEIVKPCRKCGENKNRNLFDRHSRLCIECRKAKDAQQRKAIGSAVKETDRKQNLKRSLKRAGLSEADFALVERQIFGPCWICQRYEAEEKLQRLSIDHDHVTGHFRGLLCSFCNHLLGCAHDDPEILSRAAIYLTIARKGGAPQAILEHGCDEQHVSTNEKENEIMQMPKEVRERIAKARASTGGNNIRHGEYILMFLKNSYEKMNSGWCFINEFLVVEAKKIAVMEGEKKLDIEPNAVGTQCSVVINYDGKGKQSADGNSKSIVLGLFNLKEGEVPDAVVDEALGDITHDKQPACGMLIKCSTFPKEVRSRPGNYITGLKWECIAKPGEGINHPDEAKKRIAAYEAQKAAAAKTAA